jgi:hypothetical protein
MSQGFLIGENLLGQIKDTVKRVQGEPIVGNISRIETRFEGGPPTPASKTFRICTFTGAWAINGTKTVTFRGVTATPNTVSATNLTMHLPDIGLSPPFDCQIAKDGTAWYLVSALEHNVKRGTFSAPWNKNSSKTVTLVNGGSVTALNRHANVTGSGTKNCTVGRDGMDWELIAAEC